MQSFNECIIFAVIRLLWFKADYRIGRKCLVVREIYGFDDGSPSVGFVA